MKDDEDKSYVLDAHKLILASGEAGDRIQFCEYISKNLALYNLRNGYVNHHFFSGDLSLIFLLFSSF
jgi:hypothetical protein